MKKHSALVLAAALLIGSVAKAQPPETPKPQKEHEWLKQFVGEWDSVGEGTMGPGQPAMKCKGTMNSRMLGDFWIVSDIKGDVMGMPMTAMFFVGYDPKSKTYIGSWIDSIMDHMWKYRGTADAGGKIITLEAEGPSFTKPGEMAKYRDVYEFKTNDHIVMSSEVQGDDGKWTKFMKSDLRRKKKENAAR